MEKEIEKEIGIEPLEYKGEEVFSTRQVAKIFGCSRCNILGILKSHKNFFERGKDFYYLSKEELSDFKAKLAGKYSYPHSKNKKARFAGGISLFAKSLYLWTKIFN